MISRHKVKKSASPLSPSNLSGTMVHMFSKCRVKTIFLSLFLICFLFLMLLNVMVHQLNHANPPDHDQVAAGVDLRLLHDEDTDQGQESFPHNDELHGQVHWKERKPQAAHSDGEMDKGHNYVHNHKTDNTDSIKKKIKDTFLFPNRRKNSEEYTYEENIENVVIQDDGNDDDDDKQTSDDDIDPDEDYNEEAADQEQNILTKGNNGSKSAFKKPPLQYEEINIKDSKDVEASSKLNINNKQQHAEMFRPPLVVDGIFWSKYVQQLIPKGMSRNSVIQWIQKMHKEKVKMLQPPSWDRCGRPKNGFIIMQDGTEICARHRHPHDKMVLGEVMSFYLSLLLNMDNIPPAVLSHVNQTSGQWASQNLSVLEWKPGENVALIQWIDNMDKGSFMVTIPPLILEAYTTGTVINSDTFKEKEFKDMELREIVQWGSMIIFDYLTGNYDRVASMQDAADKENKPDVIQEHIRNLRKTTTTGKYWLIDNESGLLDAYDLLYHSGNDGERFIKFHRQMLQTMCLFESPLVRGLTSLHASINPHEVLEHFIRKHEPLFHTFPMHYTYDLFKQNFSKRLSEVMQWIKFCQDSHKR